MNKPLLNGPKRQHFLPKFYLEKFTKNGTIAVFDRELNEIRIQQPINTCVVGHLYTFEDSEGRKRYELERLLNEYETKASSVIAKLEIKENINNEERIDLAIFVALAEFRTPHMFDSIKSLSSSLTLDFIKNSFYNVEEVRERMRGKPDTPTTEPELDKKARELIDYVQSNKYKIETNHSWAVKVSMENAFKIAPIIAGRNWDIIHLMSEKKSFVTTDAPVFLTTVTPRIDNFYGIGFGNSDALVLFPLSQSCLLMIFGNKGELKHKSADIESVRQINLELADCCQRFVIGRDEALVRSLTTELSLANKTWIPKMQR